MWIGIVIGAVGTVAFAAVGVTFLASVGAAKQAREALDEVQSLRQHLFDRDLAHMLDEVFDDEADE